MCTLLKAQLLRKNTRTCGYRNASFTLRKIVKSDTKYSKTHPKVVVTSFTLLFASESSRLPHWRQPYNILGIPQLSQHINCVTIWKIKLILQSSLSMFVNEVGEGYYSRVMNLQVKRVPKKRSVSIVMWLQLWICACERPLKGKIQ